MSTITESVVNGRVTQGLRHMIDETERALRNAADSGDAKVEALRLKFEARLLRLRMDLDDLEDRAALEARRAGRAVNRAVHTHPYQSMGAAAALGLVGGLLIGLSIGRPR